MQNCKETKIWNATLYLRLSRDDGDKEESNSITGQRELLRDFIRTRPEFREYAVRIDDGFTGSNFDRPSFKKMLEDPSFLVADSIYWVTRTLRHSVAQPA